MSDSNYLRKGNNETDTKIGKRVALVIIKIVRRVIEKRRRLCDHNLKR